MKKYQSVFKKNWIKIKLDENLRLSDFKKHSGISDFTKKWKDERQGIKGAGNKSAKLVRLIVNKKQDYVTFVFFSSPTYTHTGSTTAPKGSFKLKKDKPFYTQEIRILDFFKWARTTPGYKAAKHLSTKDLKEILEVAYIQAFCNDPSYHWQGDNWVSSQFNASIYPTSIPPKHWEKYHHDDNFVCKHLSMIFSSIDFWINPMTSMLNKYLNK